MFLSFLTAFSFASHPMTWQEKELFAIPATLPDTGLEKFRVDGLTSFLLEGAETSKGEKTFAYAYWGLPDTPAPAGGYPGIVLVHGGGGTAIPYYANMWRKRGYAVIIFDHYGQAPLLEPNQIDGAFPRHKRPTLKNSWFDRAGHFSEAKRFDRNCWIHNVIPLITRANTFLRSQKEVNPDKIGLAGISWGAVTGSIAASFDKRFDYAILCYGCGHWDKGFGKKSFTKYGKEIFDPKYFAKNITIPVYWVAGTNDNAFEIPHWESTYTDAPGTDAKSLVIELDHDHVGWAYEGVYRYADSRNGRDTAFPLLSNSVVNGNTASCKIISPGDGIIKAELCYTLDRKEKAVSRKWQTIAAEIDQDVVSAPVPAGAKSLFFNVYDRIYSGKSHNEDLDKASSSYTRVFGVKWQWPASSTTTSLE